MNIADLVEGRQLHVLHSIILNQFNSRRLFGKSSSQYGNIAPQFHNGLRTWKRNNISIFRFKIGNSPGLLQISRHRV